MLLISPLKPVGMITILSPFFNTPVSTLPTGTTPVPLILYASWIGTRSGLPVGFGGSSKASIASIKVGPSYHESLSHFSVRFSAFIPLTGTNGIFLTGKPMFLRRSDTASFTSL